ncbi:MAG: hypothetical protein HC849_09550 [Oscillatoriales cyanobacterium RU_3_3]|nr:hypothetical protein [Oscillatoriales cyanobacterium RU_3_3]
MRDWENYQLPITHYQLFTSPYFSLLHLPSDRIARIAAFRALTSNSLQVSIESSRMNLYT